MTDSDPRDGVRSAAGGDPSDIGDRGSEAPQRSRRRLTATVASGVVGLLLILGVTAFLVVTHVQWRTAWLVVVLVLIGVAGVTLWVPMLGDRNSRASLGSALVTGGVISAIFFVLTQQDEKAQRTIANREALTLQLTLQRDLAGIDLSDETLPVGFDLGGKDLQRATLNNTGLTKAILLNSDLSYASLDLAHLEEANLRGAQLRQAVLDGADLAGAKFDEAHLEGARLGATYAKQGGLRFVNLEGAELIDAHMRGACLAGADLRGAKLGGADLAGADLDNADLRGASFIHDGVPINLSGASLAGAKIDRTNRIYENKPARSDSAIHAPPVPAKSRSARVIAIGDGDEINVRGLGWVRLIGVNAPNLDQPYGRAAKQLLGSLIAQGHVRYLLGRTRRESRPGDVGRSLGYVWASGTFVNAALLQAGDAIRETTQREGDRYVDVLDAAELAAKTQAKGVWSLCPGNY